MRARQVIDGAGSVISDGAVLIDGALIEAVGRSADLGEPDAQLLDLGDCTVLPGLIDVHNHLTFPGDATVVQQVMAHDIDGMLAQGRVAAAALLAAGITTVRDLGALGDSLFRLAHEVAAGETAGPQIVSSTAQLTSVGGPNHPLGGACADLAAARARIDADAERGARVVKVMATGSVTDTGSDPTEPVFDDPTVIGIVDHAHSLGLRVAAHAHGSAGIAQAARCGVDTIEHASFLASVATVDTGAAATAPGTSRSEFTTWADADTLALLEQHRPWIVPTLATAFAHNQAAHATPQSTRNLAHRQQLTRLLLERGLPLATGTDGGGPGCPNLSLVVEIEQFHQLGMTRMGALTAATGQAADCLGLSDRGLLRPGLRADLLAVPGDPLRHLDVLRAPTLVVTGGRIAHRVTQQPTS